MSTLNLVKKKKRKRMSCINGVGLRGSEQSSKNNVIECGVKKTCCNAVYSALSLREKKGKNLKCSRYA
jgi:hypothetical protein